MKIKLDELADVAVGQTFRSRLEKSADGNLAVLQMKDLSQENRLIAEGVIRINLEKISPRQLLKRHDIVFRARGLTNTAVYIDQDIGPAVVAAPLLRIRVSDQGISPAYLAWWINQPMAQAYMVRQGKGTTQRMISVPALKELCVDVPSLEIQRQIVELAALTQQEQKLLCTLADKCAKYMEGILLRMASGSSETSRN